MKTGSKITKEYIVDLLSTGYSGVRVVADDNMFIESFKQFIRAAKGSKNMGRLIPGRNTILYQKFSSCFTYDELIG